MARANNKELFYLPIQDCWKIFSSYLNLAQEKFEFKVYLFVLMNNHYHMIGNCSPKHNLGEVMAWFQKSVSKDINTKAFRTNHVFGGAYKATLIQHPFHFASAYKYVARNPVHAGIVESVQTYPFSSLNARSIRAAKEDEWFADISKNSEERSKWLNEKFSDSALMITRSELQKTVFNPKDKKTRQTIFHF